MNADPARAAHAALTGGGPSPDRLVLHVHLEGADVALCGTPILLKTGARVTTASLEAIQCPVCRSRERRRRLDGTTPA